jgi:hypothetical protein
MFIKPKFQQQIERIPQIRTLKINKKYSDKTLNIILKEKKWGLRD